MILAEMTTTSTPASTLLSELTDAIRSDDLQLVNTLFRKIDLAHMKEADQLLVYLTDFCGGCNVPEALKIIMGIADEANLQQLLLSSATRLLKILNFKEYKFMLKTLGMQYFRTMCELADANTGQDTALACVRLDEYFGLLSYDDYQLVAVYTLQYGLYSNFTVLEHVTDLMRRTSVILAKPSYVLPGSSSTSELFDSLEPYLKTRSTLRLSPDAFVFLTTKRTDLGPYELEGLREQIWSDYRLMSEAEQIEACHAIAVSRIRLGLQTNVLLYQVLGPSNLQVGTDLSEDGPCTTFGGCRMFTCTQFQITDEEASQLEGGLATRRSYATNESVQYPWFKGSCDVCLSRIAKPCYAVRRPMPDGGWNGCFCSWDCVEKQLCLLGDGTIAQIPSFRKEMMLVGIQDRDDGEEIVDSISGVEITETLE